MKITIFGATGGAGQHLVRGALQRGYAVTAFARNPEKLAAESERLKVVQGDVQDAAKVDEAIASADAVISLLGPRENKPVFTITQGTEHILAAMDRHGVERLVISVGAGVSDPNDDPNLVDRVIKFALKLVSRWVYADMARAVARVRQSDVNWTVVRVPMLTDDEAKGEVKSGYVGRGVGPRLSRADMANFMLDQVESDAFTRKAPAISN
jgi:putative NADH-flavin reductase